MQTAQEISLTTGGYISAIPLQNVTGVPEAFDALLSRVQALPFVPAGWSDLVRTAMTESGSIWIPRPAIQEQAWLAGRTTPLYDGLPDWLTNDTQAAVAWNTLTDWWKLRLQPILAGWARSEKLTLDAANDDAVFWNGLYAIVKPVAMIGEAILAAPVMVADAAAKVAGGVLGKLLPIIAIVAIIAVGVLVYKNKMTAGTVAP